MENISHTLAGLAMAEVLHHALSPEASEETSSTRRRLLLTAAALAGNFPDLDLIFVKILPKPLGYLLHHRGHTHTVLFALPQALLLFAALWLFWPRARRLFSESRATRFGLAFAIAGGFCLHLLMDALNSYGIHPLYPFDPNWFYGDMVFIVEPLFWVALGVPIFMTIKRSSLRLLALGLLLAVPTLFTIKGYFLWPSLVGLFAIALALAGLYVSAKPLRSVLSGWMIVFVFLAAEALGSRAAKANVAQAVTTTFLDAAVHSYPTNPFCWMYVSISKDEASGIYRLQKGKVSSWPQWLSVKACPQVLVETILSDSNTIETAEVVEGDLKRFRELAQTDCQFAAWLRFARMPILTDDEAHDFRFSTNGRPDFSMLPLMDPAKRECPTVIPGWGRPREDLL